MRDGRIKLLLPRLYKDFQPLEKIHKKLYDFFFSVNRPISLLPANFILKVRIRKQFHVQKAYIQTFWLRHLMNDVLVKNE